MRKSKYEQKASAKIWQTALYIRLSREDGDKEESDSIVNQRALLLERLAQYVDLSLYDLYIDDGYTGTDFLRPDFLRMMGDVEQGRVQCIMVKDLSRLGRNYVEVGNYLEKVFPLHGVRFIALQEGLDSVAKPQDMNNLIVPFRNILNDEYCRDISLKVRSALDTKRRQGKFIGAFAAYGYRKDPQDHNKLVVDEPAAQVVREIFSRFLSGESVLSIARELNRRGVPNPSAYKRQQGLNVRREGALWSDNTVRRILKNRTLTGAVVQGKSRLKSHKLHVAERLPEEQWTVVEGCHEAIIEKDRFLRAQARFSRDTRISPQRGETYLFSGYLKCADCKRAMNRKRVKSKSGVYDYYVCSTYKKNACTKHTIRCDHLERAVLEAVRRQIAAVVDADRLIRRLSAQKKDIAEQKRRAMHLEIREKELQRHKKIRRELYKDWKEGLLGKEDYLALTAEYDQKIADAEAALAQVQDKDPLPYIAALEHFLKYRTICALSRELVCELIDTIYVHEGGKITVVFRFSRELQNTQNILALSQSLS